MELPSLFRSGIIILLSAALLHFFFIALFGRLPRWMGWLLTAMYLVFLYQGFGK